MLIDICKVGRRRRIGRGVTLCARTRTVKGPPPSPKDKNGILSRDHTDDPDGSW